MKTVKEYEDGFCMCRPLNNQKSEYMRFAACGTNFDDHSIFITIIKDGDVHGFILSMERPEIYTTPADDYIMSKEDKELLMDLLVNQGVWNDLVAEMKFCDSKCDDHWCNMRNIPDTPPDYTKIIQ